MSHDTFATSDSPALVLYLIDVSDSMRLVMPGGKTRIAVVTEAMRAAIHEMVFRCTDGSTVLQRYRIGMCAYSDKIWDLLEGVRTIDEVARIGGAPVLQPIRTTYTAKAFEWAERVLEEQLPDLQARGAPAPLICHLTDGEYNLADPSDVVRRVRQMRVPDGNVLVENIFISEQILPTPVTDVHQWPGVLPSTPLVDKYAAKLREFSSPLPQTYREMLVEHKYHLAPGALMMLPGTSPEMVRLGFQMTTVTPMTRS